MKKKFNNYENDIVLYIKGRLSSVENIYNCIFGNNIKNNEFKRKTNLWSKNDEYNKKYWKK